MCPWYSPPCRRAVPRRVLDVPEPPTRPRRSRGPSSRSSSRLREPRPAGPLDLPLARASLGRRPRRSRSSRRRASATTRCGPPGRAAPLRGARSDRATDRAGHAPYLAWVATDAMRPAHGQSDGQVSVASPPESQVPSGTPPVQPVAAGRAAAAAETHVGQRVRDRGRCMHGQSRRCSAGDARPVAMPSGARRHHRCRCAAAAAAAGSRPAHADRGLATCVVSHVPLPQTRQSRLLLAAAAAVSRAACRLRRRAARAVAAHGAAVERRRIRRTVAAAATAAAIAVSELHGSGRHRTNEYQRRCPHHHARIVLSGSTRSTTK